MNENDVTIVTGNTKKYTEMTEALSHFNIKTKRINLDIDEIKDLNPEHVIRDKVLKAFEAVDRKPVLVDDSGIYFDTYNGFPGTYSKFAFQSLGYDGLFELLREGDVAHFRCYVGYMDAEMTEPIIFIGEYSGSVTTDFDRTVETEMPYALFFVPDGQQKPMADMSPEERSDDHRHKALNAFAEWFATER